MSDSYGSLDRARYFRIAREYGYAIANMHYDVFEGSTPSGSPIVEPKMHGRARRPLPPRAPPLGAGPAPSREEWVSLAGEPTKVLTDAQLQNVYEYIVERADLNRQPAKRLAKKLQTINHKGDGITDIEMGLSDLLVYTKKYQPVKIAIARGRPFSDFKILQKEYNWMRCPRGGYPHKARIDRDYPSGCKDCPWRAYKYCTHPKAYKVE